MIRKAVTLLLFVTTVPMAVFGQNAVDADHVRSWLTHAQTQANDKWPATRKHLEKSLPHAVQSLAPTFGQNIDVKHMVGLLATAKPAEKS